MYYISIEILSAQFDLMGFIQFRLVGNCDSFIHFKLICTTQMLLSNYFNRHSIISEGTTSNTISALLNSYHVRSQDILTSP